jgi:large subunit ribosomal protein L23
MSSTTKTARDVILAPVVSEKSYALIADRKYTFKVHADAHRTQVKQAVEEIFDVRVASVNMLKVQAKPKRRGVYRGTRAGYKKAIVTLREGHSIAFYEGVA